MKTIIKVEIRTYQITYMVGVLYMESGSRALVRDIRGVKRTQQGNVHMNKKHRNAEMERNKKQDLH